MPPRPPRPSCASRRRSASRASRSCSRPPARSTAAAPDRGHASGGDRAATPLFSLDQTQFETALATDHVNVEETARKVSRRRWRRDRGDRHRREGADRRHRPDGLLRQLPAPPADAARHPRRGRRQSVAGGAVRLSRIDEATLVIGLSAGRPHPLIVRTMKLARHRKAPTLAITDATLSEVARLPERTLYYSSNSPAYVRSHVALLSLIQALAYGVYARDARSTRRASRRSGSSSGRPTAPRRRVDRADARLVGQLGEHLADDAVHVRLSCRSRRHRLAAPRRRPHCAGRALEPERGLVRLDEVGASLPT